MDTMPEGAAEPLFPKNPHANRLEGLPMRFQPPLAALQSFQTALPDMFYLSHLGLVELEREHWRLRVGGLVQRSLELGWDDLARFPRRKVGAAHECAGNPLFPTVPVRRVGNVEWEGVALADVLAEAGVLPQARFVWSVGMDAGHYNGVWHDSYQKDLPLQKALAPEVLLATHINGVPLPPERGGPVRLVVPGFYGTNSTKWLAELSLEEGRCPGYFTTVLYNDSIGNVGGPDSADSADNADRPDSPDRPASQDIPGAGGQPLKRPVWAIAPHALLVSHQDGGTCAAGPQTLAGWAWAGCGVAQVEVSVDGGASWQVARLEPRVDFCWQRFTLAWSPRPGPHRITCRALAVDGTMQLADGTRNAWQWLSLDVG